METLLALDTSTEGNEMKKSTILRLAYEQQFPAARINCHSKVIGYYCVSMIYADLPKERHMTKMNGKKVMQETAKTS